MANRLVYLLAIFLLWAASVRAENLPIAQQCIEVQELRSESASTTACPQNCDTRLRIQVTNTCRGTQIHVRVNGGNLHRNETAYIGSRPQTFGCFKGENKCNDITIHVVGHSGSSGTSSSRGADRGSRGFDYGTPVEKFDANKNHRVPQDKLSPAALKQCFNAAGACFHRCNSYDWGPQFRQCTYTCCLQNQRCYDGNPGVCSQ